MRLRVRCREYDNHLVEIGHYYPLTSTATGLATRKLRRTRHDLRNHPAITALAFQELHVVTDGELHTGITDQLQPPAERRFVQLSRVSSDLPDATGAGENPTQV